METIETKHGTVEVLSHVNKKELLVRFTATGGTVLTTLRKLNNGTVTDPMLKTRKKPSKTRWVTVFADGSEMASSELGVVAEASGVHIETVRKIAQGTRQHKAIQSITRI